MGAPTSSYREDGERNAKTGDPVSLKVGALDDGWLPETASAMAFLVQQTTSREAEAAAEKLGRLDESGQHILDLRALALSNRFDAAVALTLAPLRATVRRAARSA